MPPASSRRSRRVTGVGHARRFGFVLLALCLWAGSRLPDGRAEPPGGKPLPTPFLVPPAQLGTPTCAPECPKPALPPAPEKPPRPLTGADSVASFVDNLSSNDAAFEVIVGQGRILT